MKNVAISKQSEKEITFFFLTGRCPYMIVCYQVKGNELAKVNHSPGLVKRTVSDFMRLYQAEHSLQAGLHNLHYIV